MNNSVKRERLPEGLEGEPQSPASKVGAPDRGGPPENSAEGPQIGTVVYYDPDNPDPSDALGVATARVRAIRREKEAGDTAYDKVFSAHRSRTEWESAAQRKYTADEWAQVQADGTRTEAEFIERTEAVAKRDAAIEAVANDTQGIRPAAEVEEQLASVTEEAIQRVVDGKAPITVDQLLTLTLGPVGADVQKRKRTLHIDELAREALAVEKRVGDRGTGLVAFDTEFWSQPRPRIFVPGLLAEGQAGWLYAAGGVGKSLLSLEHRTRTRGAWPRVRHRRGSGPSALHRP